MIPVIIFYIHFVFLVYIFTKTYIEENILSALLSVVFIVIIFSVGWTISEFIMSLFMESEGVSLLFPRYAFSLMILSVIEVFFYRFYYSKKPDKKTVLN
jgi:hypothetical protein